MYKLVFAPEFARDLDSTFEYISHVLCADKAAKELKKGECHGAKNTGTEDIVFVSIVAPVPADYDPVKTN